MAELGRTTRAGGEQFGGGVAGAVGLHLLLGAGLLGTALLTARKHDPWGDKTASVGAIQASLVSALPLPPKATPVKDNVLAEPDPSDVPKPPPTAPPTTPKPENKPTPKAPEPPPKPTDVLIKSKTPDAKANGKIAPTPTPAQPKHTQPAQPTADTPVKHPVPTPDTTKATNGSPAMQMAQTVSQLKNGTSTITLEDRAFGARYAYYIRGIQRVVTDNYYAQDIDARSAQGKSVTVTFVVEKDGSLSDIKIETRSGSGSLDTAAVRALQRVDGFGPLPAGDRLPIEYTFGFHVP